MLLSLLAAETYGIITLLYTLPSSEANMKPQKEKWHCHNPTTESYDDGGMITVVTSFRKSLKISVFTFAPRLKSTVDLFKFLHTLLMNTVKC